MESYEIKLTDVAKDNLSTDIDNFLTTYHISNLIKPKLHGFILKQMHSYPKKVLREIQFCPSCGKELVCRECGANVKSVVR